MLSSDQFLLLSLQYIQVEDPVRRRTNNSLTAGATVKGQAQLQAMRGLILLPEEVDFGVLKEGNTYAFTVLLKNTGVDTCRYKIKQPPPATGIRILFKPGPVSWPQKNIILSKFKSNGVNIKMKYSVIQRIFLLLLFLFHVKTEAMNDLQKSPFFC